MKSLNFILMILMFTIIACSHSKRIHQKPEKLPTLGNFQTVEEKNEGQKEETSTEAKEETPAKKDIVLFKTNSKYQWLVDATACANKVFNSEQFKKQMSAIESFTYASKAINGNVVLDRLNGTKIINARTYYKRFTSAVAYSYYNLGDIYLNTKTQPWEIYEIVETLVHETTHVYGFSHGNNYPDGKEESVPYKTGTVAKEVAMKLCK